MPKPPKKKSDTTKPPARTICDNRRARYEYELFDTYQAGIELLGTEVKSMRQGKANLQDSFARIENHELWLYNLHVSPYDHGNRFNHDPLRPRKLLVNQRELLKIQSNLQEKGLTLIPLKLYFHRNWIKVDLALAKGRRIHDKRETIAKREIERQLTKLTRHNR